jgi:hypothetical protein
MSSLLRKILNLENIYFAGIISSTFPVITIVIQHLVGGFFTMIGHKVVEKCHFFNTHAGLIVCRSD